MQATVNTYLKYIDLIQLENWSVQGLIDSQFNYSNKYQLARIGDFLIKSRNIVNIEDDKEYSRVTVKINNNGVVLRDTEKGVNIGTKKQYRAKCQLQAGAYILVGQHLRYEMPTEIRAGVKMHKMSGCARFGNLKKINCGKSENGEVAPV